MGEEKQGASTTLRAEPIACGDCKWFQHTDVKQGECRYNPPVITTINTPKGLIRSGNFPPVKTDSWCSKFELKITLCS